MLKIGDYVKVISKDDYYSKCRGLVGRIRIVPGMTCDADAFGHKKKYDYYHIEYISRTSRCSDCFREDELKLIEDDDELMVELL